MTVNVIGDIIPIYLSKLFLDAFYVLFFKFIERGSRKNLKGFEFLMKSIKNNGLF